MDVIVAIVIAGSFIIGQLSAVIAITIVLRIIFSEKEEPDNS